MLEFYKTFEDGTRRIAEPEPGCWINAVAPTEEERNFLIEQIGILPEFVKSSLDEEESSHIDYDDEYGNTCCRDGNYCRRYKCSESIE